MRKSLLIICLFTLAVLKEAQTQTVKPLQYTVLIERTVHRNFNPVYKYVYSWQSSEYTVEHCFNNDAACCGNQANFGNLCYVEDPTDLPCSPDYHSL